MLMQIARINFNLGDEFARADAEDPYQFHRSISRAFCTDRSDELNRQYLEEARPLFRLETAARAARALVASRIAGDWNLLRPGLAVAIENCEWNTALDLGAEFPFALRARPTETHAGGRRDIRDPDSRLRWLSRKAQESGFEIIAADEIAGTWQDSRGRGKSQTLLASEFRGALRVADPDLLSQALASGIGRGKSVGFGMLCLPTPLWNPPTLECDF